MRNIQEELTNTLKLLKLEWETDLQEYRRKFLNASIASKKEEGVCWYPVQLKTSKHRLGDRLIVELERIDTGRSHSFQSGKSVSIFTTADFNNASNMRISGVINQVKKDTMTVTLSQDSLPDWAFQTRIGVDLLFDEASYREMESAMKSVIQSEKGRLGAFKQILLGEKSPEFSPIEPLETDGLNESQQQALRLVIAAKDVAVIHGPPGTGKTTTLVASIVETLRSVSQVMVTAPSNAAVDLLVEKLVAQGIKTLRMGHPARVDEQILAQTLDAKIAQHDSYKDLKRVKKSVDELRKLASKYKRNYGQEERMQKRRMLDEVARARDEAAQLEDYIVYDIFQETQVVACTLVGAAHSMLDGRKFPVVFIDEAAQGLEPAVWIPVQKAQKIVMAGDHCQLPPTIKSYEAAQGGLAETLFEKVIKRKPAASHMLNVQYRMPELIAGFSSDFFYHRDLHAAPNIRYHFLDEAEPVLEFVDTAGSGFAEQTEEETFSTFNPEEAKFCLGQLESLIKRIGIAKIKTAAWNIGLIAPYKAQVRKFNELLFESYNYPNLRSFSELLTIDSIDGFQGQERDIILLSLVRSNTKNEIGFLSDTRRMNVALTRAKRKLIVVGDSATLSAHPFYHAYIDYVESHGCYHSVYEYLG
ncbi:AAA domain-containing protein [Mariniradius sediminis]|uniref:DNA helicase n=1 Tax=Mariniradius sediminis TaxID=2909237 RepID=A0ABS9BZ07_9BACT|nr:AAA domain-containing protein [Mariniradius sediminis]MCF1752436.1 AAA domain-containing protein [Mariniradius sediminis]